MSASAEAPWPKESYSWYVVFVLSVCGIVAFIDRQIINLLVEDIKLDLGVTDVDISLLQGLAFAMFYATVAIPLGRLADSVNRRWLIAVAIVLWTFAAISCGLADTYGELFVARMAIGIGEAVLTPAGFSMLADYYKPSRLSLPLSVFTAASFVGSGIALLAGGAVIGHLAGLDVVSLPWFGQVQPWQAAFIIAATPGFFVAVLLFFTVKEPRRRSNVASAEVNDEKGFLEALAYCRRNGRLFFSIFVGLSLLSAAQFSLGAWVPSFFIRVHGWTQAEIGSAYGLLFLIFGTSGVISGGWIANWLHGRGYHDANLRVPMVAAVLALPFTVFPLMTSATVSLAFIAPLMFLGTIPFGAGTAVIPIVSPSQFRAQLVAIYLLIANFLGQAGGPWFVALWTDKVFKDPAAVGYSLLMTVAVLLCLGAGLLFLGLRPLRQLLSNQSSH
jgi:MFS family permease